MRVVGMLHDPRQEVSVEMLIAYAYALQSGAKLASDALAAQAFWAERERSTAGMLTLIAFARGDCRLVLCWHAGGPSANQTLLAIWSRWQHFSSLRN